MQGTVTLTLIVQARDEMASGHWRDAGRLVLEAADAIETPDEADEVEALAAEGFSLCEFVQRGRFESALELIEERRAEFSALSS